MPFFALKKVFFLQKYFEFKQKRCHKVAFRMQKVAFYTPIFFHEIDPLSINCAKKILRVNLNNIKMKVAGQVMVQLVVV